MPMPTEPVQKTAPLADKNRLGERCGGSLNASAEQA